MFTRAHAVFCLTVLLPLVGCQPATHPPATDGISRSALAVGPVRHGPGQRRQLDVQANSFTMSTQNATALDQHRDGRIVAVWQSRRQEQAMHGIYAQQFDGAGRRIGSEVHINGHAPNRQSNPAVALDAAGSAWFGWDSMQQDGAEGGVVIRRFDAQLQPLTADIIVNDATAGHQGEVAIDSATDGRCAVAWTTPIAAANGREVRVRIVNPDGRFAGPSFAADPGAALHDRHPQVAFDADGSLIVVWARSTLNGRSTAIMGQRFEAGGQRRGPQILIADARHGAPIEPALSLSPGHSWSVAWAAAHMHGYRVYMRAFDARDKPGEPQAVEQGAFGGTRGLAHARSPQGRSVVVWGHYDARTGGTALYGRMFDQNGLSAGDVFRCTAQEAGERRLSPVTGSQRVVVHDDGRLALAWSGAGGAGDDSAAVITLSGPADSSSRAARPRHPASAAPADRAAAPHEPPTFDILKPRTNRVEVELAEGPGGGAFGFLGIPDNGWNPPDPHIAVGPDDIMIILNGNIAAFKKDGTLTFIDELNNENGFWGPQGATVFVFDPEVRYDEATDRFFAMANERNTAANPSRGYLLLAVSQTGDPSGAWYRYRFDVTDLAGGWDIDSPNIALHDDTVYLTADYFGPDEYFIYTVDKADVVAGSPNPATNHRKLTGEHSWGLAVDPADDAPRQYFLEAVVLSAPASTITVHAVDDPFGDLNIESFELNVSSYFFPEDPPSNGTTERVNTFEARFWDVIYRNGSLWATHHVGNPVRQRWYEIDLNGWPLSGETPVVAQSGEITPGNGVRTFFGSIWVDELDNMAMTFARSSPSEFLSMYATYRTAGDPPGTTQPVIAIKDGTGIFDGDRWGDYSGIAADPAAPGAFWMHHMYGTSTGWRTWIAQLQLPQPLALDIRLSPAMVDSGVEQVERCVNITLYNCETGEDFAFATQVNFGPPAAAPSFGSVNVDLPEGDWTCISIQDPKHTLTATCPLDCSGSACTASFTASPQDDPDCHWLIQGNFSGDDVVDISDLSMINTAYLMQESLISDCGVGATHADCNGDGFVSMADMLFVVQNFGVFGRPGCADLCDPSPIPPPEPRTAISVLELEDLGYGELAVAADIDGDGLVDLQEFRALMPGGALLDTTPPAGKHPARTRSKPRTLRKSDLD